jgi:hypothetical protein
MSTMQIWCNREHIPKLAKNTELEQARPWCNEYGHTSCTLSPSTDLLLPAEAKNVAYQLGRIP